MSQYSTGLSSVTNGSPTVTGTNTLWLANVTAGDSFTVAGDGVMYDVASVDSDTQITLSVAYAGSTASGVVYTIARDFTSPDDFPELTTGDIETPTIITRAFRKIQSRFTGIAINTTAEIGQAVSDHEATNDHPLATTIAKGFLSAVDKTKLDTVESGATADQTDAEIKIAYESNADTNEFSDAEQTKLLGIEDGATADQTDAEIKIAYESNANTNEFSDAEQTKLLGIEDGATADQTKADIDALNIDADTLDGIDSLGFDAAGAADTAVSDHVALPDPHSQYAELSGAASANFTLMPQVGGDPIVESGSNADGEWTKFSDGTLLLSSSVTGNTFVSPVRMNGVGTLPVAVTSIYDARLFGQLDSSILAEKITLIRLPLTGTSTIALRVYSANGDFVPGDETDAVVNVFTFAKWQ